MTSTIREIYCCECSKKVNARLTDGSEIYPHRKDLCNLPFWKCDGCSNYVGCHHKTKDRTNPLGNMPNPEIRKARQHIHKILDPLWQTGKWKSRDRLYSKISERLGWSFHTAKIKSVEEAREVYKLIKEIAA